MAVTIDVSGLTDRQSRLVQSLIDILVEILRDAQPPPGDGPARLLSIPAAAERLGVSRTTLYQMIGSGSLRTLKVGRRRLVPEDEIDDVVAKGRDGMFRPFDPA